MGNTDSKKQELQCISRQLWPQDMLIKFTTTEAYPLLCFKSPTKYLYNLHNTYCNVKRVFFYGLRQDKVYTCSAHTIVCVGMCVCTRLCTGIRGGGQRSLPGVFLSCSPLFSELGLLAAQEEAHLFDKTGWPTSPGSCLHPSL